MNADQPDRDSDQPHSDPGTPHAQAPHSDPDAPHTARPNMGPSHAGPSHAGGLHGDPAAAHGGARTPLSGAGGVPSYGADWAVPLAVAPIRALVRLPGSKSMTNRALVLAALAERPTLITGPLVARDTALMVSALRSLGCRIRTGQDAGESWWVEPGEPGPAGRTAEVDVGNAGTVLRFVPPVAALTSADVTFRGDARVAQRPVGPLLAALRELGAMIDDDGTGAVPFLVRGRGGLSGGTVTLDASSSSQLISGLLLAAPRYDKGVEIRHSGPPVPSAPHIEMTVRMLRACGADVTASASNPMTGPVPGSGLAARTSGERAVADIWRVLPGPITAGRIEIEPDLSNAAPFLAAALATGGEVTVADWPADSLQPAAQIIGLLSAMGATVTQAPAGMVVRGSGEIRGITADLSEVGELTPVLTALAALASSPSEFGGIGHLRRHESDRLAALASEIGKLGGEVTEVGDGLRIRPRPLRADGVVFDSHDDHRLVTAAAVLGLVAGGLRVRNAASVGKTFPGFTGVWARMLAPAG
ncbi:MAG TPA: 3-phosphoshikimate 1-carboxyvinyltransferase [Streptosporangiaceae bacterium]|nr:3-phosphoshikimate 1-carboxyvinyltransferase [Streptosporangiaceae bacterium]